MFDFQDFNVAHFLEALAQEYLAQGSEVDYLPFVYGAEFLPIAGNTTAEQTVTIDHDSDFILCAQTNSTVLNSTGAGVQFPADLVEIEIQTGQRSLQSDPAPLPAIFGTGQRPFVYYKPLVLSARSSFRVRLQRVGSDAYDSRFSFLGVKAFLRPAA